MIKMVIVNSGPVNIPSVQRGMLHAVQFIGIDGFQHQHKYLESEDSELCIYTNNEGVLDNLLTIIDASYGLSGSLTELFIDISTLFKSYVTEPYPDILQINIPADECEMIINVVLTSITQIH